MNTPRSLIKDRLTPSGVVSINLMGSIQLETNITASVVRALLEVFDQVDFFRYSMVEDAQIRGVGNLAVLGYNGAPRDPQAQYLRDFKIHPRLEQRIRKNLGKSVLNSHRKRPPSC